MEFLSQHNIISFLVIFLLIIVLVIQIQMGIISSKLKEQEENLSKRIEELLKKKIKEVLRNQ